ncbi:MULTISPECIES: hypothetical protein [Nostoc]|uniref:Uncharacterized protein n=1 Tax=Nostoc paludosum FACHB-159 TaxID=2692908 RepID=A0ABR8K0X1_9NOSO|nr:MULTISPECIES: hypothetical protein [Nostoc]MBD2676447.1 hypothetical protein [Nostoc sp. FACHB-857]MBD2732421.1 hypothetical protein [Nostoc paludosum FACHB-159]
MSGDFEEGRSQKAEGSPDEKAYHLSTLSTPPTLPMPNSQFLVLLVAKRPICG